MENTLDLVRQLDDAVRWGINMLWRASKRSIRDSVTNAMKLAAEHGFQSVAFPLVGAGSGGFNLERARRVMLDEIQKLEWPLEGRVVVYKQRQAATTTSMPSLPMIR